MPKKKTSAEMRQQLQKAEEQRDHWAHREERLAQKVKYTRSAKERKRTHRLIQYGVAFECNDKRLEALSDVEVYSLVEGLLDLPEVKHHIDRAMAQHEAVAQKEGDASGTVPLFSDTDQTQ